jgi:hypothetical protein
MKKVILEFTLNGHKRTYYRRTDVFGEVVTTVNQDSARLIKENEVPGVLKKLIVKYGKENVKDVNLIKKDGQ